MKVYFIGAGPGDPDLITVKGLRLLASADVVIYAGSLVNPEILEMVRDGAELHDSAGLTLEETIEIVKRATTEGKTVVRLHAGDPSLYGTVREQMEGLESAGIECEVVPGVSSFSAAAASLRREYTVPGGAQTLIITRMAGRTPVPETERLASLALHKSSMSIYLSVHLIEEVVRELLAGYPPDTPVAVVEKASLPEERVISGTLDDIAAKVKEAGIRKTALILVGEFLTVEGRRSLLYDPAFSHGLREGKPDGQGKIWVVGLGPGGLSDMSFRACEALREAEVIVGYQTYLDLIPGFLDGKTVVGSAMTQEVERCSEALAIARSGKKVAVVCSGDPGVYGMAGLIMELAASEGGVPIEVIPGITAATAAAALLGAPLMNDFTVISLSDLMTPWEVIERRLIASAEGDLVTVLYNPRSRKRIAQLERAREIFLQHRGADTPVGIVRKAGREGEQVTLTTLGDMLNSEVDMLSTVIVGNSQTRALDGRMVTARGYVI